MHSIAQQLSQTIEAARVRLLSIPDAEAGAKPYADKWSLKETLGHLIDSAANNHQRIVRMQERADIGLFEYEQMHWVNSQHYQQEAWPQVVELWYRYNAHLAFIIDRVDPRSLGNTCDIGYAKPATLTFVIEDYLRHLNHHLDQIFGGADPRTRQTWEMRVP
ncbi:MAG TPA: DinB family protein [Bacteroidota bacterium]|nr:DinB family protein [Bacteroidota bacterium]